MKSRRKRTTLNLITSISYKLVVIAVGLIIPKLFISNYGSEINGLQTSVKQIFTYIALLEAGVGASTLQMLYRPVAMQDTKKTNQYLSAASIYYNKIGVTYFIILIVAGLFYSSFIQVDGIGRLQIWIYVFISGALTGLNFFYVAKVKLIISAMGDLYVVSFLTMVTYIVSSIMKIALIYFGAHIILIEAMYLFINLGTTYIYFCVVRRKYPWISFKAEPDFSCVEQKNAVLVHRITSVIFQNVDILFLTFFCSLEMVSIYSLYKMVINMISSIIGSFGESVNFILGQNYNLESSESKPRYCNQIDAFNVFYSALAIGLYTVLYILILPFLSLYTKNMDINYIYPIVPILYIIIEFLTVGREAMTRTIDIAGHYRKTQSRAVVETVINLSASFFCMIILMSMFGEIGGLYGVLLGTILALLYRTLDIIIYAEKHILHRKPWKSLSIIGGNALIFIFILVIFNHIQLRINNYIQFILHGVWMTLFVMGIFVCGQAILHPKEVQFLFVLMKGKRENRKI